MDSHYSHQGQSKYVSSQSSHEKNRASRNRKMFIQRNSQQQQEIVIPYWDDESSSHYHLIEEIRLLKKKNQHFQSHMGRMKQQYQQLKLNLQQMDENQKQHIRRFTELNQRYSIAISKIQQLKTQMEMLKHENDDLRGDLKAKQIRQQENRKKIHKLKDQQTLLNARILELQSEIKLIILKFEQEKRVLQRSRDRQIQMLRLNFQQDNGKINMFNQLILQLKSCVGERDQKIQFLQKQFAIISKECQKLKDQKINNFGKKPQHDIQQLIDRYNKQIAQLNKIIDEKDIKMQISDKGKVDLNRQIDKLKTQNLRLAQQNVSLRAQIFNFQNEKRQQTKKGKIKKVNNIIKTVDLIYVGIGKQKQKNPKQPEQQQKWKQILRQKQLTIFSIKENLGQLQQKLQKQKDKNRAEIIRLQKIIEQLRQKLENKQTQITALRSQKNVYINQIQKYRIQMAAKKIQKVVEAPKHGQKKQEVQQDDTTLGQLEAQYNAQLQALRRLVLYKKYPQSSSNQIQSKLRLEYQNKFDILVGDYQQLQKQLLFLQEQLIFRQHESAKQMITFRTTQEERILYLQAIRKWQIAYEQLHAIYEAKLVSKDEQINLLNLRLVNLN